MTRRKTGSYSPTRARMILSVPVQTMSMRSAVSFCEEAIRSRQRSSFCFANVHVVVESLFDRKLKMALRHATAVFPDGMPLVWFMRYCGDQKQERIYGPDFMLSYMKLAARKRQRVFLYGSTPLVLAKLKSKLEIRFHGARIVGTLSPPFKRKPSPAQDRSHVKLINAKSPDIVFVGLGAPRQEIWMWRNRQHLKAPVLAAVGAAFDFHAGTTKQAPRWMMNAGLEWLFRLATEPRRLWRRYLFHNSLFLMLLVLQELGLLRMILGPDWRRQIGNNGKS